MFIHLAVIIPHALIIPQYENNIPINGTSTTSQLTSTDIDMALNYLQCCCVWKGSLARLSTDSGGSFFFKGQENIFVL